MPVVTFQVLEGIDKGRIFRELPTPVTIGREEGNLLRLNDERVSRFHAKVQSDNGEIILTDLGSTNGTRVNNNVIQIRRLRPGDLIGVGRSLLRFGSEEEINARNAALSGLSVPTTGDVTSNILPPTVHAQMLAAQFPHDIDFSLDPRDKITITDGSLFLGRRPLPPLPQKMTPSQAARLAELLDFLHRHLSLATEDIRADEEGARVTLCYADWQRVMALQMILARYVRAIAEPESLEE
jgi:hypothetical protein